MATLDTKTTDDVGITQDDTRTGELRDPQQNTQQIVSTSVGGTTAETIELRPMWAGIRSAILAELEEEEDRKFWQPVLKEVTRLLGQHFPDHGGVFSFNEVKDFLEPVNKMPRLDSMSGLRPAVLTNLKQMLAAKLTDNESQRKRQKRYTPQEPKALAIMIDNLLLPEDDLEEYEWLETEGDQTKILAAWQKNIDAWPGTRANDYKIMVIGGGSGSGKTTTGRQLQAIVGKVKNYGFPDHLISGRQIVCEHVFILPHKLTYLYQYPPGFSVSRKPPRDAAAVTAAGELLSAAMACFIFFSQFAGDIVQRMDDSLDGALRDIRSVLEVIRVKKGLAKDDILVLILQIDEFQKASYLVLNMMRSLSDSISGGLFKQHNVLIVPVPTGTAIMSLESIEEAMSAKGGAAGASTLSSELIPVARLTIPSARTLTTRFAHIGDDAGPYNKNPLFEKFIEVGGRVPLLQKLIGQKFANKPCLDDLVHAELVWNMLVLSVNLQYPKIHWVESFGEEKYILRLMAIAILKQRVSYNTQLNGSTIGDHLASGVLFPVNENNGEFHLVFPLVLLFSVAQLFNISQLDGLAPFKRIDEDGFEVYVCKVITALCYFFTLNGDAEVSVGDFFFGGYGTKATLDKKITIKQGITYRESVDDIQSNKEVRLIAEGWVGSEQNVDLTRNPPYVIRNKKRSNAGDAWIPFADLQIKSSLYVTEGKEPPKGYCVRFAERGPRGGVDKNIVSLEKELKKVSGARLFVLISNKPWLPEDMGKIPENVVVICQQNLKHFFRVFATGNVYCP